MLNFEKARELRPQLSKTVFEYLSMRADTGGQIDFPKPVHSVITGTPFPSMKELVAQYIVLIAQDFYYLQIVEETGLRFGFPLLNLKLKPETFIPRATAALVESAGLEGLSLTPSMVMDLTRRPRNEHGKVTLPILLPVVKIGVVTTLESIKQQPHLDFDFASNARQLASIMLGEDGYPIFPASFLKRTGTEITTPTIAMGDFILN